MPKENLSRYQKSVISGYYANLDTIMLGRLSELVTELYLADSENKRKKLWARAEKAMNNLKIPPAIKAHILEKQNVEILAKNLNDWQGK